MGKCCSKPQTSRPNSCRKSRYRLLRILRRHDERNGKLGKKDTSYKRGEPDGSEEVAALQGTKKQKSSRRNKNAFLDQEPSTNHVDGSDIDIYPVKRNEENGISEDEDKDNTSLKENVFSQLVRERIIKGDVNTEVPNLARMVKIVVASIQEDMAEERLILDERIFPDIKKFCREQNYDAHIVDVDINHEQYNYGDWKDEIRTAHEESIGVGFIVLVGQNLGERLLPEKIDVKDFELLLEIMPGDHDAIRRLYELDASAIPCYVLKKACFNHHDEIVEEDSQLLLEKMEDDDSFKRKCEQQYVFNALLQAASLGHDLSNQTSAALWVERSFNHHNEVFDEQNNDDKAELRLLREKYARNNSSIITYEEFVKQDIMKRNSFHKTLVEAIKEQIQIAAQHPTVNTVTNENLKEVAQHIKKCQENVANIDEGSQRTIDIQRRISTYLRTNTRMPLVIHGAPGCGKSTMVAMAAKLTSDKMVDGTTLVLRFLGSTRYSSNLRFLLRSICFQLTRAFENKDVIPEDFQSLVKMFHNSLHNATKGRRIVIILDGLDELPKSNLLWLPRELPDNVRIVLTALTNGGYYNNLKATFEDGDHFIDVGEIDKTDARSYMTSWYQARSMEVAEDLNNRVLSAVTKCPNNLYLKILLHHNYHRIPLQTDSADSAGSPMPNSLKHVIEHYFVTMEKRHGKPVIQRIMGYLSAARFGLSERELEEVLTRENISSKVPSSRFHVHSFQLSRILHDLSPCVSKVYFDGMLVLTWRHLIIRYLAFDRYLSNRDDAVRSAHQTLAQYFAGKHSTASSEDPLIVTRRIHDLPHYLCKLADIENLKDLALCNFGFLLAQLKGTSIDYLLECFTGKHCPMDSDLKMIVDALKMSSDALHIDPNQLAAQLIGRLTDLASSDHISRLLNDARKSAHALIPNTGCLNPPGTKLLHTSMELYGPTDLTSDSTLGLSASKNIVALWDVRSGKIIRTTTAGSIVRQVRFCRNNRLFVIDAGSGLEILETSTFKKIWELECPGKVRAITLAGDSKDVLVAACGHVVKMWNLRSGMMMSEITELEGMSVDKVDGWREYVACASSEGKYVRIYEVFTGMFVTHINAYEKNTADHVGGVFISSFGDGLVLTSSDTSFDVRVFRLCNGEWLRNIGGDIVNPRLTSDGHYILSTNSRNDISVWSLETGLKLTNVFRHPPTSIITDIIANDLTVLVTLSDNRILRVWDLEKEETIQQGLSQDKHDNCIRNIMFVKSRGEQRQAVSRSKVSGDIVVWNLSNCKPVRILKGTQADDILVVDETRAVLRSMGKLALIDLEEGRLIKKLRVSFPNMRSRSRLERRASSLYKRRNLSLRLLQRSGVTTKPRCAQFCDVAIVGRKYVVVLSSKRDVLHLISLDDGHSVAKLDSGHKDCIETILVSANGKTLVASYEKTAAAVWDLETRRIIGWLRVENTYPKLCQAAITRDGKYLVDEVKINDCTHVVVWQLDGAEVQCKVPIPGATVHALAASSDSGIMICSFKKEYRNTVMAYTLRSGAKLFPLPCGIRQQINSIHLSLDGKRAMTFISGDRTIRLWDTARGVQVGSFTADHAVSDCALSDDGNNIVLAIYKASTIASLSFASQTNTREVSVDLSNPYYNPRNYGAVFEFLNILDWDDDTDHMDDTFAEKQ